MEMRKRKSRRGRNNRMRESGTRHEKGRSKADLTCSNLYVNCRCVWECMADEGILPIACVSAAGNDRGGMGSGVESGLGYGLAVGSEENTSVVKI